MQGLRTRRRAGTVCRLEFVEGENRGVAGGQALFICRGRDWRGDIILKFSNKPNLASAAERVSSHLWFILLSMRP